MVCSANLVLRLKLSLATPSLDGSALYMAIISADRSHGRESSLRYEKERGRDNWVTTSLVPSIHDSEQSGIACVAKRGPRSGRQRMSLPALKITISLAE